VRTCVCRGAGVRAVGAQPCKEIRSCGIVVLRGRKKEEKTDGYIDCVCVCVCVRERVCVCAAASLYWCQY